MKRLLLLLLLSQTPPAAPVVVVNPATHIYHTMCPHVKTCTKCKPIASVQAAKDQGFRPCALIKKETPK